VVLGAHRYAPLLIEERKLGINQAGNLLRLIEFTKSSSRITLRDHTCVFLLANILILGDAKQPIGVGDHHAIFGISPLVHA
jgi:hypothetical protein